MPARSRCRDRLLDGVQVKLCKPLEILHRFLRTPCAVRVGAQFDVVADGFADGFQTGEVIGGADFYFDLAQAEPSHSFCQSSGVCGCVGRDHAAIDHFESRRWQ